ncbi:hypothetical protein [Hymenobacter weizhouensis]|uniref:hypothetical protein n=1 Tax=Hymenobacter sp. YIM 151500-1 TaxID=2987689 RepID=UPI002227B347|nr:hypothetical protein [Hymenobacter sp. YIM 151500-1]UYZ62085.1 hypothetical protein OIS53_13850 [Hymenobacter sp. YIM 151500-1]
MKQGLRLALVFALYAVIFVVCTWPLLPNATSSFLAVPGRDSFQFFWNAWHFRQAAVHGHNPYHTDWLFFPRGTWLVMHAYTPVLGILGTVLGSELLGVNVGLWLSFALSGTGAYVLARRWLHSPVLGLLAGFVFAFSPFKLQRLPEHYNLVLTATVPFYVLALLQAFAWQEGRWLPAVRSWRAVAACAVLGVVTLFSDYYVLFGLLYFTLAYAAWFGLRIGRIRWRAWRTWAWLGAGLLASHVLIKQLRHAGLDTNGGFWWGGDVVAFFLPPPTSRWLAFEWAARLHANPDVFNTPGSVENTLFVGYALPALAIGLWVARYWRAAAWHQDPLGRPLAWVLGVLLLLTVPGLRIYGHEWLNLPTSVLHFVPFFNNIRCPTRWIMLVGLVLPIVSLGALEAAWRGRLRPATQTGLGLLLCAVVAVEYWPRPYHRAALAAVPAVYQQVRHLAGTSLIPVPLGVQDGHRRVGDMATEQLFYQAVHRKKLPGGYVSRVSPALFQGLEQDAVLSAVLRVQSDPAAVNQAAPTPAQLQDFLRTYDPAAFVFDPAYARQPVRAYVRRLFEPLGFTEEEEVGGYVLLRRPARR